MRGVVDEPALTAAELGACGADAAFAGPVVDGPGDDEALLERVLVGPGGRVDVGDVVRDGVQPLAVDQQPGPRDPQRVEYSHLSSSSGPCAGRCTCRRAR